MRANRTEMENTACEIAGRKKMFELFKRAVKYAETLTKRKCGANTAVSNAVKVKYSGRPAKPAAVMYVSGLQKIMPAITAAIEPNSVAVQNLLANSPAWQPPLFLSTAYPGMNTALRPPSPSVLRNKLVMRKAA